LIILVVITGGLQLGMPTASNSCLSALLNHYRLLSLQRSPMSNAPGTGSRRLRWNAKPSLC